MAAGTGAARHPVTGINRAALFLSVILRTEDTLNAKEYVADFRTRLYDCAFALLPFEEVKRQFVGQSLAAVIPNEGRWREYCFSRYMLEKRWPQAAVEAARIVPDMVRTQ